MEWRIYAPEFETEVRVGEPIGTIVVFEEGWTEDGAEE